MAEILDSETEKNGGSPITSYSLEWDEGTGGVSYVALIGSDSDNLVRTFTREGLTTGASYAFRYRVRNIYDWSSYSEVLNAVATQVPSQP
jgi:hypothetical protein